MFSHNGLYGASRGDSIAGKTILHQWTMQQNSMPNFALSDKDQQLRIVRSALGAKCAIYDGFVLLRSRNLR